MNESAPEFDNSTKRPASKLAFGRDINRAVDDAMSGGRGVLPPEFVNDGFDGMGWGRVFVVHVTGAETGFGKYVCDVYAPHTGDLADPEADFTGDTWRGDLIEMGALFANLDELGSETHTLTDEAYEGSLCFLAQFVDHTEDGRMVLVGTAFAMDGCSTTPPPE